MKRVLAGGCFNKIHPGHIYFLKKAKKLGHLTVVLTNKKNNKKPYAIPAAKRKKNLQNLKIANQIVIGHPTNYKKTVEKIKPDIIVLGYDQKLPRQLISTIKDMKVKTKRIKKLGRYSSRYLP